MAGSLPSAASDRFDLRVLLIPLALVAVGLFFMWGLAGEGSPDAEAEAEDATVAALIADPQAWAGREVTITGTVEERYASRSFSLGHQTLPEDVVVMTRGRAHEAAREEWPSGEVEVTGTVRLVEPTDAEILGGDMAVRRGAPVVVAKDDPVASAPAP